MPVLSGLLWPAHPHPFNGECLSSWLIRCAHDNGLKAQTFCRRAFFEQHEIWNRDIDRLAPDWLIEEMAAKTGVSIKRATQTTLRLFEGRLFPKLHHASQLRWVTPLKLYHRTYLGYGMQYCPMCLREDKTPYFRLAWRCSMYTFCPRHNIMLHDRCHNCGSPVEFHRLELGKPSKLESPNLDTCWNCEAKLSGAPQVKVRQLPKTIQHQWLSTLKAIDRQFINSGPINYYRIHLLHQICRLITSSRHGPQIRQYLKAKTTLAIPSLLVQKRSFDELPLAQRHQVCTLAWWLAAKTPRKLQTLVNSKVIKSNMLYKDAPDLKPWVLSQIGRKR